MKIEAKLSEDLRRTTRTFASVRKSMRTRTFQDFLLRQLSIWRLLLVVGGIVWLSSCAVPPRFDAAHPAADGVAEEELASYASAPRFDFSAATVLLDNDEAFEQKLRAVRNARKSLDLAYYIFANDYSSSLLAEELVAAARRGVRVRVLLDYFNNYRRLDLRNGPRNSDSRLSVPCHL